jgi:hypothetical protein
LGIQNSLSHLVCIGACSAAFHLFSLYAVQMGFSLCVCVYPGTDFLSGDAASLQANDINLIGRVDAGLINE